MCFPILFTSVLLLLLFCCYCCCFPLSSSSIVRRVINIESDFSLWHVLTAVSPGKDCSGGLGDGHEVTRGPDSLSDTVVGQWDKTYSGYESRQTLTSPSDSVWCLMRIALARFLSDTTHCPMVTSKSVGRQCLVVDQGLSRLCTLPVRGVAAEYERCDWH